MKKLLPVLLISLGLLWSSIPSAPAREGEVPVGLTIPNLGVVKREINQYHDSGEWEQERAEVSEQARHYLEDRVSSTERPTMVLDIDETSLDNWGEIKKDDYGYNDDHWLQWEKSEAAPAIPSTLALFKYARSQNVTVFFITGRGPDEKAFTEENLHKVGYDGYKEAFFKPEGQTTSAFKTATRKTLTKQGWHILVNEGDQASDLVGGYAEATFKLPNPAYLVP